MFCISKIKYYTEKMAERGIAPSDLLTGTGLQSDDLRDVRRQASPEQYSLVVSNMLLLTDKDDLGIDIGRGLRPADYGILGYAMASSKDVRRIYQLWELYNHSLYGAALQTSIDETGANTSIYANIMLPPGPAYRFCMEEFLFSILNFIRMLTRSEAGFSRVELSYPRPAYHRRMSELLNCPICYDASANRMVRQGRLLDEPVVSTNLELNELYAGLCAKLAGNLPGEALSDRIRSIFLRKPDRIPKMSDMAREFAISERTLNRRLRAEGNRYRDLVNQFRCNYAKEYLRTTKLTTKEIAFSLGYQDDKAFLKAFKSQVGTWPSEFRAQCQSAL